MDALGTYGIIALVGALITLVVNPLARRIAVAPPADAVDEGDRDEGREHVDAADGPGRRIGLGGGRREPRGGENLVGVVDDRVDAGDLLQDRKPEADFERRPPARRAYGAGISRMRSPSRAAFICISRFQP